MTTAPGDIEVAVPSESPDVTAASSAALNDEVLDRRLRNPFTGFALAVAVILVTGFALRFLKLDSYLLGEREASWAMDGWSIFTGAPLPGSAQLPDIAPLFQVAIAVSLFIFGDTDAIARFAPAILGFGIVVLVFSLRPFVSRSHLAAMATFAAISPTLVYASRTIHPAIAAAFFALFTLIALLRAGVASSTLTQAGWALCVGLGIAGMLGSGIEGVTALLSLAIGVFVAAVTDPSGSRDDRAGVVRRGVTAVGASGANVALLLSGFALVVFILFSRFLTDFSALIGILTTFSDWGRLMMSRASALPFSFYFWSLLLYELVAVVFALLAVISGKRDDEGPRQQQLNPMLFGAWFFAALVLQSFASGRSADQSVLVVLPLLLLAGLGLGDVLARIDASGFWHSKSWGLPVMVLGLGIALVAVYGVVVHALDPDVIAATGVPTWLVIVSIAAVALVTLASLGALPASPGDEREVRIVDPALLMIALALGLFTVWTTAGLSFYRADDGVEMLARDVPTAEAGALIDRINQVSRDLSVESRSAIDPTGRFGLRIAISPDAEGSFPWYFRDYPFLRVTPPAGWNQDIDVGIANTAEGMETFKLTPRQHTWMIRQPASHRDLDAGGILGRVTKPDTWAEAVRYLVSREIENTQEPVTITVGYSNRVNNQLNPNFGPFDLFSSDYPGPGTGLGQLNQPSGIGVSPDGSMIYVLNAANQRIDRFERDGTFVGVWDAAVDPALGLSWNVNQGGTGLTVGKDGLIYIADTWNHTVIVVDQNGTVVRQLGQRGGLTDTTDSGSPTDSPGLFFGPRGVAVTENRIFVTDTGNERVQVFAKDGTFINAFGGFGTRQGQLIEPTGIIIGPDGDVWVADSGNARIQVFTIEGEFLREIAVPSWLGQMGVDRLNALALGPDGVVYMTSPAAGTIEAYANGELVTVPNVSPVRAGGITVTPDGHLLITDVNAGEVHDIVPELPAGFGAPEPAATPAATPGASPEASPVT